MNVAKVTGRGDVNGLAAVVRLAVLLGLGVWFFWLELRQDFMISRDYSESSFALASPVVLGLLVYRRWGLLSANVGRGSLWGVVLMMFGLAMLAAGIWPYPYGYVRHVAIVPVAAGAVLASGGRRVFVLCLPMVLWVWLCIPIAQRIYHRMIVETEPATLSVGRVVLDMIPDVAVELDGPELSYIRRGGVAGTIAAAEPHRGMSLLLTYVGIGVFVTFATIRPIWQVVLLAGAALPIALFCNLVRLLVWGFMSIYGAAGPIGTMPRGVAVVVSICLAYGMFVVLSWLMNNLVMDEGDEEERELGPVSSSLEVS